MLPESRLIKSELTLRELSLPPEVVLTRKAIVRWLALSFGLIHPNESRLLLLDVFDSALEFHIKNINPTTRDIIAKLEENTKEKQNPKAVYYHLQRLTTQGILARKKGRYYIGDGEGKKLNEIFREYYIKKIDRSFENIGNAFEKLQTGQI
ncbi:hypothetical protein HZC07_01480 [Candidatus Micrarchaeota archaeon]|nr:hypothetical protein [Candidatus Micrarchaeota archaeon]